MKKIILSIIVATFAYASNAQVVVRGVSPVSIANNYEFSWADPAGHEKAIFQVLSQVQGEV